MKKKLTIEAKAAMFFQLPMSIAVLLLGIFTESSYATFFRYAGTAFISFWIPVIFWELTNSGYLPLRRNIKKGSRKK